MVWFSKKEFSLGNLKILNSAFFILNLFIVITSISGQHLISTSSSHYKFQTDPIKVCFSGASSWKWKIAIVAKDKTLNGRNVNKKWLRVCGTKTCKGKILDCVTFDANLIGSTGEYKVFLTTKSFNQKRAGPVYFTVSTEGPIISTDPPTLTPTNPPTELSVCDRVLSDAEEVSSVFDDINTASHKFAQGIDGFVCGKNKNRSLATRSLQEEAATSSWSKITDGLEFISGGPLGWVSFAFSVGTWIAGSQDTTTQEILDKVNEISNQINDLSTQLSDGVEYIVQSIDVQFKKQELSDDSDALHTLIRRYKDYMADPEDDNKRQNFVEKCYDNSFKGFQPIDIFERFYATSCTVCKIKGTREGRVVFNRRTGEFEDFLDYFDRYSATDEYDFRNQFGNVILTGMVNAFLMHVQCPPRTNNDAPKCEDERWLDEVDAMKEAIEEVAGNLDKRARELSYCTKREIRLKRVSKINIRKLADCGDQISELQFKLNNSLYMPKQNSHCTNGMCRNGRFGCRKNNHGWDKDTCTIFAQCRNNYHNYRTDAFRESPWVYMNPNQKLYFSGKEANAWPSSHKHFSIATFLPKDWNTKPNTCAAYTVRKTGTVNGESGSIIEVEVRGKARTGSLPKCSN